MRSARPSVNTVFKFLPYDDSSINVETGKLKDVYQEYLKTANLTLLNIDKSKSPSFYWFRPLNGELWQEVRDLLGFADGEHEEDAAEVTLRGTYRKVISYCLIGADYHPEAIGVSEDGKLEVVDWSWKVGEKEPAGLKDSVLKDDALVHSMFQFIVAVSVLTEEEKKV